MAGPPPGRQQPPNSSDTLESIRRCHQPPARPLPPATAAAPTASAATRQLEESGVWPDTGHALASRRVRKSRRGPRDTESVAPKI